MRLIPTLAFCCASFLTAQAVTVYNQLPMGQSTSTAASASYTGAAAYDPTVLTAPAIPNPAPPTQFTLELQSSGDAVQGLSIRQSGSFLGFSIETSVVNQVRESYIFPFHPRDVDLLIILLPVGINS